MSQGCTTNQICSEKQPCDCCAGPRVLTPLPTYNRPGLSKLRYRVGTHATFFETMQARLSSDDYPELAALRTREKTDPSIALLDAWAIVGDVLSFYQERIANEGYLRTATERRSVLELARLIGYALRPGVAASVYLAYSLDKDAEPVTIPQGARANSIPGPGEQMQAFETSEPLEARVEWNAIKPRLTQPQTAASIAQNGLYLNGTATKLKANDPLLIDYADGTGLHLAHIESVDEDSDNKRTRVVLRSENVGKTMAALIHHYSDVQRFGVSPETATTRRVLKLIHEIDAAAAGGDATLAAHLDTTALPKLAAELDKAKAGQFAKLTPWLSGLINELQTVRARMGQGPAATTGVLRALSKVNVLGEIIGKLVLPPSVPPASAKQLARSVETAYGNQSDTVPRLLTLMQPLLKNVFYASWKSLPPPRAQQITVYALRVAAAPFGNNAPLRQTDFQNNRAVFSEWNIDDPWNTGNGGGPILLKKEGGAAAAPEHHEPRTLYLDNDYDIAPDSYVAIEKADGSAIITQAELTHRSLAAYGLSGKTVQVVLPPATPEWVQTDSTDFEPVRTSRVYAGSEKLDLAEEPIDDLVAGDEIELGDVYNDLQPGRWLIVAGERADVISDGIAASGVKAAELVMLAGVTQKVREEDGVPVAGDTIHTTITLAKPLAYTYKRDTVTIYGNVVDATNGETRQETLGAGNAAQPLQQFTLKQPPLTYVSAATVSGVASTLEVRVNDVEWHEVDSLAGLAANERKFITRTDDEAKTTVVFGNGVHGARLPTGPENVKAVYRNGIGKPGNVKARQISLLNTRPLGVKEVINPIRASGGADKEGRDQARKNAPLAVMALDRLVSTPDYADFSRTFGGVGKAAAARLSNGRQQLVHVTIAGVDDIPIDETSDLYRNLYDALHRYGDPYLPIQLALRERLALVVSANIRVDPDYQWETLEPKVRRAVLDAFSFDNVDLAQDLLLADAIKVMQAVPGVVYVDVDVFDTISETDLLAGFTASAASVLGLRDRIVIEPARFEQGQLLPAQLSYLSSEVPDTLILQEIKS